MTRMCAVFWIYWCSGRMRSVKIGGVGVEGWNRLKCTVIYASQKSTELRKEFSATLLSSDTIR